ncbi:hypothetical protein NP202_24015, partial [Salmonella enterica]|nr:hypothetical protein [Salmonella enterica]
MSKIKPEEVLIPWVTSGTQKWNGAVPSFIIIEMVMRVVVIESVLWSRVHWLVCRKLFIIASMRIMEAVAWERKYFVAASIDRGLWFWISIGMNANIFISRPIHIMIRWELNMVIRGPVKIVRV